MSRSDTPSTDEVVAAEWLLRIEDGLAPDEQREFAQWIEGDPGRAEAMARQAVLMTAPAARPEAPSPRVRRRSWRGPIAASLAAAAAAMTFSVLLVLRPAGTAPAQLQLATGIGAVNEQLLSDTSRLWIDARTDVTFRAEAKSRVLELETGRIYVEVERDPQRPFTVSAGAIEATAVGTAFEVTRFPGYSQVQVTEGRVRVVANEAERLLAAGESLRLDADGTIRTLAAEPDQVGGWRSYRLTFRGARLADVIDEMNRYRSRPLAVEDPELASQAISGVFPVTEADEPATPDLLAAATGSVVSETADRRIILSPASN